MASSNGSGELDPCQRAIAATSALDSVRAEGLDPSGIEPALLQWMNGERTIADVIQAELDDAARVYGPPASSDRSQ